MHILSHPWEVQRLKDGTLIEVSHRDLDMETVSVLIDELFELAVESGRPTLYLDFARVNCLATVVAGKLFVLDRKLHEVAGRLVLRNLSPALQERLQEEGWPMG